MKAGDRRVLLLTGPPGAGKTTVARSLARGFDRAVHLESDQLFHVITAGYIEPWRAEAHAQNTLVMQVVADMTRMYANAGYVTVVDGILTPGWFLEPVRDTLTAAGIEVSLAVLRPSVDRALLRDRALHRRVDRVASPVPRDIVEQLWNDFADLGQLERHVIDNGELDVAGTVELLADRWRLGSLVVD